MRYACLVMGILFVLFTYWQFNDLEQYNTEWWQGWVLTYALCAVVSVLGFWKALPKWFYAAVSIVSLLVAAYWSLGIEWHKTVLYNEENPSGNESGGLVIIAIWFCVLAWKHGSLGCKCDKK